MKYPWEKHAYAGFNPNMRDDELIAWLRYHAIENGAPNRLIDRLGELACPSPDEVEDQLIENENRVRKECCNCIEYMGERLGLTDEQIKQIVDYIRECSE